MCKPLLILLIGTLVAGCRRDSQRPSPTGEGSSTSQHGLSEDIGSSGAIVLKDENEPGDIAHYTCSMHPSVKSKDPGTCPICSMDLTPVTRTEIESGRIVVDAKRRQLIGVKTGTVLRIHMVRTISAVGRITYDETRLTDVTLKFKGWIGQIEADYTGKKVEQDAPLFTVYSPALLTAQEEYLDALRKFTSNPQRGKTLVDAARKRLILWDVQNHQVDALAREKRASDFLPYLSPASGTIIVKNIFRGSAVEPGQLLYRLADLSVVWVEAQVYESDLSLVKVGQTATIELSYLPATSITGNVTFVYPYLDPKTRTGRIRLDVSNPEGLLKPDMYVNVRFHVDLGSRLVVPEEAVLYAGDTRLVFLDHGEGSLEPRRIKTGLKNRNYIEVLEGLEEGDNIVTSGNFLIAAESKLKLGIEKW